MLTRVIVGCALAAAANVALACPQPSLVVIPAKDRVAAIENEVRAATAKYFSDMSTYIGCIQTELDAAGGETNAPAPIRAALVLRNNAAVLEFEAIMKLFAANVGPIAVSAPSAN